MPTPDIIFLYGTSSSGKTTLAKALQDRLETVYLHVSIDAFASMFPESKLADPELCASAAPRLTEGFYRSIAALVSCGNQVIVDTIVQKDTTQISNPLFQSFSALYVAVKCPLQELERRESERGDRTFGLARSQFSAVDPSLRCDIELDTHQYNAQECAALVMQHIMR